MLVVGDVTLGCFLFGIRRWLLVSGSFELFTFTAFALTFNVYREPDITNSIMAADSNIGRSTYRNYLQYIRC